MVNLLTRVEPRNIGTAPILFRPLSFMRALEGAYLRFNPNPQILLTPQGMGKRDVALELALCRSVVSIILSELKEVENFVRRFGIVPANNLELISSYH